MHVRAITAITAHRHEYSAEGTGLLYTHNTRNGDASTTVDGACGRSQTTRLHASVMISSHTRSRENSLRLLFTERNEAKISLF
jgi:hypothetical protein